MNNNSRINPKEKYLSEYKELVIKKPYCSKLISSELIDVMPLPPPSLNFYYLYYSYNLTHVIEPQEEKPVYRIYSDIDPYGEEDWNV
jgi:hypothetical protein